MYCILTTLEGWFLGLLILVGIIAMRQWSKIDRLRGQIKGSRPIHPQDRFRAKREAAKTIAPATPQPEQPNPLDWLDPVPVKPKVADEPAPEPKPEPLRSQTPLLDKWMPHAKPVVFALSIILVWFGFASWYDNLSRYVPASGDDLGDFRILYLKKTIGALLPLISAVGAALGLLFMIHPRYYIYLNGWYKTDYDFYNDLRSLDQAPAFRRVLVFGLLFGLLLLVSLYVLLHSSPQELTL